MVRVFWVVLIFGIAVSLIWWPGMKNEAVIFALIEKERLWQSDYLGVDLIGVIDGVMCWVQSGAFNPLPYGVESSIESSVGVSEREMMAASARLGETSYFQALFALLVLALGRLCTTVYFVVLLLPVLGACFIDGTVQREIRLSHFKNPNSFPFRVAWVALFVLGEGLILVSLMPIWISPMVILLGNILLGLVVFTLAVNRYKN